MTPPTPNQPFDSPPPRTKAAASRRCAGLLTLVVIIGLGSPARAADSRERIHTVIAAMIVKLPSFAKWPAQPPQAESGTATLAVATRDKDVLATFRKGVEGRTIGNLTWRVEQASTLAEAARHQFVFFASDAPKPDADWYEARREKGVLTFGEGGENSCIFDFVIVDGRVRFDLNMVQAQAAGMGIDPRLLKLAQNVRQK